jgi:signal transduction histidine kinase
VIDNLLSNAVKYSPHGKNIWVKVQAYSDLPDAERSPNIYSATDAANWLSISIRDEGPGFTEEDKQRVFGKFARLSAQPTGGENSTGLGLSIVKRYVEGMHGEIWFHSEFGKGATFYVALLKANF